MGLPCGTFNETYRQDKAIIRTRMQWLLLAVGLALVFGVIPNVSGPFLLTTFILCGYYIIGTLGINILTGFTGQLSLGHSAFVAVGAYTGATLSYHLGVLYSHLADRFPIGDIATAFAFIGGLTIVAILVSMFSLKQQEIL